MKIPDIEQDYVVQFCKMLSAIPPCMVKVSVVKSSEEMDCFNIVEQHVKSHGGEQLFGWAVWEWPKVMIEGEFHSVWKSPEGEIIDLTPRPIEIEKSLFVHDPKKLYKGRQVNNIRKPIAKGLTVKNYIETANQIYTEMNKGELADVHGEIEATPRLMKLYQRMASLQSKLSKKYGSPL
ncbi:hypothetical protein [Shewanella algae]|uniref:hypothetical protein n=1 Tax=Shewanella algae TaxID=38313 RepID=UPI0031F557CD